MDEKGESGFREEKGTETPALDETDSEILEEPLLSDSDSSKSGREPVIDQEPEESDTFKGLSEAETEALDLTRDMEAEDFHDPDPDWGDEEIPEHAGRKKRKRWVVAGIVVAFIAALSLTLWWLFFLKEPPYPLPDAFNILRRQPAGEGEPSAAVFKTEIKNRMPIKSADLDGSAQSKKAEKGQPVGDFSINRPSDPEIRRKLSEAVALRGELLKKHREIRGLQQTYGERIAAVEEIILGEKKKANVNTFEEAIKIKPIAYGLRTIHRRNTYIENLNAPLKQVHLAAEEILYLERLANIQLEMAHVATGIDLGALMKKIDRSIQEHRDGLTRLTVQRDDPAPLNLEKLWKDVLRTTERTQPHGKEEREKAPLQLKTQTNSEILAEIQRGEFSRKRQLTWLSQEGAIALSNWEGKVLYLNGLSTLHPLTAEKLAGWGGNWLCLNGLREISPETAESLSRWPGKRLSLNGLRSISEEVAKALSDWKGTELEMVSLNEASPEAVALLMNWGTFGKRVYFSKNMERELQGTAK
jgi:hypothetical protein